MAKKIKFSLAIPVAPYRDCEILESIKNLTYKKSDYEILIEHGLNPSENRNKCIKKAKHPYIYFLDDDGIIPKDFLENANKLFQKYDIDAIGGPQLTPHDDKIFARISGYALESFFGCFKMAKRYKQGELDLNTDEMSLTTANFCAKKKVFKKVGYFNKKLFPGEDPEMFDRIKNANFTIAYSPTQIMYHRRRPDLKGLVKQIFKYGNVRLKKEKILNQKPKPVFLIPSLFVIYLITLPVTLILHSAFLIPLLAYLLIAIINSAVIAIKNKSLFSIFLLPFIYLFIHIAYGLGIISFFFESKEL